ncbi:pimeloyl-ACP methyl ester esterase BioH [Thioalkalicoccus limnaeus]|uniref:Pimeloyl-[acyl-carrier protein] methyl ester esterase n=1 Tax=Thioalkalicoccus limnaeus TaxID=120681 RepID=A0ABV4BHU6_9GAMM
MTLAVEVTGGGPDLVLIHGWGMNNGVWAGLPAPLEGHWRQHRIALPGHGGSRFDPAWRDLDAWAEACLATAPPRAVWLGWSLGGLVALAAAGLAPERVAGLVLVTATPRFTRGEDWPSAMPVGTLDQFQANLLTDPVGTLERFLALQVRASDQARATLRHLRAAVGGYPPPQPEALEVGLALLRGSDLRETLPRLPGPSLWLFGERDTLVPAALAPSIPRLWPSARVAHVPGAGHAPFLSHPRESAAAVAPFLHEVDACRSH